MEQNTSTSATDTHSTRSKTIQIQNKPTQPAGIFSESGVGSERLSSVHVRELMSADPHTVEPGDSIQSAARKMMKYSISCLPVVEQGILVGLMTEADFVNRVVAEGRSAEQAVSTVMSKSPLQVHPEQSILNVLTLMTRHRIAHMPVCVDMQLIGIVTQTDIIRHQIATSVFMVGDIVRKNSSAGIAQSVAQLPRLLCSLVDSNSSAYETGRIISSITGAATRRLLVLAEEKFGAPPVPYVWLACGSQGRQEQTGVTDQDNCIMLDDRYDPPSHADYFARLAEFVCDGLNEAGYVYCPGDMMATNTRWRQPVSVWREYFTRWIQHPDPSAQMLASVMFDIRPIYGEVLLFESVNQEILHQAQGNSIFVAHMTRNSLFHRPPLGFLNRIRADTSGRHSGTVDLKHGGVVPIVDIARLYALSVGLPMVNTIDRLGAGVDSSILSQSGARTLLDAYEIISRIRLEHQVGQIKRSEPPDNHVNPAHLSTPERARLRQSMKAIKEIQSTLGNRISVVGR